MVQRKVSEESKQNRKANSRKKEARRTEAINGAFNKLLEIIPFVDEEHRQKMPKIKTLRLAMGYIRHLSQILEGKWEFDYSIYQPRPLQYEDFQQVAEQEVKTKNTYCERAQKDEMDQETVQRIKAREMARKRPNQQQGFISTNTSPFSDFQQFSLNIPPEYERNPFL